MNPRPQTAGTAGIIAGILLAVLFGLIMTSGMTMDVMMDSGKMLTFITQHLSRWRNVGLVGVLATIAVVFYFPGLAARLRDRTPSRATGVLYFSLFGVGSHGLDAVLQWAGDPLVAGASDPVAAGHAWVALSAVHIGLNTFANLAIGLSQLLAGWAAVSSRAFSAGVAWVAIIGGIAGILTVFSPPTLPLFFVAFIGSIVFLIWSGVELRRTK